MADSREPQRHQQRPAVQENRRGGRVKSPVIVTLPPDLAAISGCSRVAVGEDDDGLFLLTREDEAERLRCFTVHQEGVIDLLARQQLVPRRERKSKRTRQDDRERARDGARFEET
jgi:hypothetical protein